MTDEQWKIVTTALKKSCGETGDGGKMTAGNTHEPSYELDDSSSEVAQTSSPF